MSRCLRCGAGNEWIEPMQKEHIAQPVTVGPAMSEELDYLIRHADESCKWADEETRQALNECILAVRQQAAAAGKGGA